MQFFHTIFFYIGESNNSEEKTEENIPEDPNAPKGLLTNGVKKKNKKRKNVTWIEEPKLRTYHYFALDETERGMFIYKDKSNNVLFYAQPNAAMILFFL